LKAIDNNAVCVGKLIEGRVEVLDREGISNFLLAFP